MPGKRGAKLAQVGVVAGRTDPPQHKGKEATKDYGTRIELETFWCGDASEPHVLIPGSSVMLLGFT